MLKHCWDTAEAHVHFDVLFVKFVCALFENSLTWIPYIFVNMVYKLSEQIFMKIIQTI